MSKEKMQKIILAVVIFFGIGYGGYEYYISVSNERIQSLNEEYKLKHEKVKELEIGREKKAEAKKLLGDYEKQIRQLDQIIPSKKESSGLAVEIYNMIKNGNIKAESVSMSFPQKNEFNITRFSIQLSGTLDEIKSAVNYFKGFDRKLVIRSFYIQGNEGNYSAAIEVDLYSMKE